MSNYIPRISDSEYEVMKVIWEHKLIKSQNIVEIVSPDKDWSEKTIKTLINRLLKKKAISYKKSGRAYLYYPLIEEKDYKNEEGKSLLNKFYNGSLDMMLVNFIRDIRLSEDELDQIKKLLDEDYD